MKQLNWSQADSHKPRCYLAFSDVSYLENNIFGGYPYLLIAANSLNKNQCGIIRFKYRNHHYILDSGVFTFMNSLTHKYDKAGWSDLFTSLDVFSLPEYKTFFSHYLEIVDAMRPVTDFYIEIDIGDAETKTKTRNKLESMGYTPTPVFHSTDSLDYLRFLLEKYDRICIGALTSISDAQLSLLSGAIYDIISEAKSKQEKWVHFLGTALSSMPMYYTVPEFVDSYDATTYIDLIRFGRHQSSCPSGNLLTWRFPPLNNYYPINTPRNELYSLGLKMSVIDYFTIMVNQSDYFELNQQVVSE